jgi:hypothetical protein
MLPDRQIELVVDVSFKSRSGPLPIVDRRRGARRRPRPLIGVLRHGSDCDLLGDFDSTIDLDAKITNRSLDLRMADTIDMMCCGSNTRNGTGAGHERQDTGEF